ncbi:MAG TPA: multidrug effflux MFS transporter [Mycobacterium sp.]|nr:multidrug effflux MFS transporter [Mycobacterium sp.]
MTGRDDSSVSFSTGVQEGPAAGAATVTTLLILTLALQSAVPPFATDMYTPAFPRVTADLATSASLVGLTLTTFFLGMALGQLLGGPLSDQRGRRIPLIVGGLICTIGAVGCALAPSIGLLIVFRVVQGFGGGFASVVARAVVVDIAKGDLLARVMSIMMALGGLAPMVAPVLGGAVLTLGGTWRTVFWILVGFGLLMMITAIAFVPESLPPERRHGGGLRQFTSGLSEVLRIRLFVGYMLTAALSGFTMMAYIANSSYVLQVQKGLRPLPFALFFASTALAQVLLSVVNAKIVGRFRPRALIGFGLTLATVAVAALTVGVFALDTPLLLTCCGFLVLMAVQAFIFGNASALAAGQTRHVAGAASAVLGVVLAVAMATAAPLASSGGGVTAEPMIWVMIAGIAGSLFAYLVIARPSADRTTEEPMVRQYLVVANHTLGGQELLDAIRDRMARGPAEFWILAPATPSTHLVNAFNALSGAFPIDSDLLPSAADVGMRNQRLAEAKSNLDTELDRLRTIGATADGAVGDPDPMKAIEKTLADARFDEIILSTLPPGISRWLAWDLPHRVRRRIDVPLTVITTRDGVSERSRPLDPPNTP